MAKKFMISGLINLGPISLCEPLIKFYRADT